MVAQAKRAALWQMGVAVISVGVLLGTVASIMALTENPAAVPGGRFPMGVLSVAFWSIGIVMVVADIFRKD